MKFKMKPIESVPYIIIKYLDENEDMFIDKSNMILKQNATEIQKEILKCYMDDEYFSKLSDEMRNKIYQELVKY